MSQNKYFPESAFNEAPAIVSADVQESIGVLALFGNLTGKVPDIPQELIDAALARPAWTPALGKRAVIAA